jgi:cytochrome c-type biogenesis protein CcmH/NrfF
VNRLLSLQIRLCRSVRIASIGALVTLAAACACSVAQARPSLPSLEPDFMCVECHEPLELVSSPEAEVEKQFLQGLIDRGESVKQITASMVANYGVAVLAKPPPTGFNLTLYILPPAILVLGAGFLLVSLPRWRERGRRAAVTPLEGAAPLPSAEAERLEQELAHFR